MSANATGKPKLVRYESLDDLPPLEPLPDWVKNLSDEEITRRAIEDPDAGLIPDSFWENAVWVEPETTKQITLRLPARVVRHFKATGKGYHSRISAVLAHYVDAQEREAAKKSGTGGA